MASVRPDLDSIIAHMPGVKAAVHEKGREIGVRAQARLAAHRQTGAAEIREHVEDTDYVVELVDTDPNSPAALAIEAGRGAYTRDDGVEVAAMRGLRILRGALDEV